jgi:hypothetical protein
MMEAASRERYVGRRSFCVRIFFCSVELLADVQGGCTTPHTRWQRRHEATLMTVAMTVATTMMMGEGRGAMMMMVTRMGCGVRCR